MDYGDDKTFIGLYHAPINGASTDLGYDKFDESISLEHFDGCDIVMLGDIHKRQEFIYKGCPIVYPGSLIQQGFGENVSKHGFLEWDVKDRAYVEYDLDYKYSFYKVKINNIDDIDDDKEILINK